MRDQDILKRFNEMEKKFNYLQASINRKETTIYSMWAVLNTLLHMLREKDVCVPDDAQGEPRPYAVKKLYTLEEFTEVGKELQAKRLEKIKELAKKAKAEGKPIEPGAMTDQLQQHINEIKPMEHLEGAEGEDDNAAG